MKILVTGGAGFIGSALIRFLIRETDARIVNVDKLTYAAPPGALAEVEADPRYAFEKVDICDRAALDRVFAQHRPDVIVHLAAESHVDRSIDSPAEFIQTNVLGTYALLETALDYWRGLDAAARDSFRLHHVSTDEVFGSLGATGAFDEQTPYRPNSPYSASKAASDHLVRAWHHTFGLPVVTSNCSNNYGPFQFPEKLIPLVTINALLGEPLPVYGRGENVRDWLHVEDHARALWTVLTRGRIGETYNVGGDAERPNLAVVEAICDIVDELAPRPGGRPRRALITFVEDRPGHDLRYAMDAGKLRRELGWRPQESFASGLRKTVAWYLRNETWWRPIREARYDGARLGTSRRPTSRQTSAAAAADLLVLGGAGQIGGAVCAAARRQGLAVQAPTRAELDTTDAEQVAAALRASRPRLVVNAAAYTAVDRAESKAEAAFAVNASAAGHVAEACRAAGAALVHISTDYVFDGAKAGAYVEDDPVRPLSVYGASKEAGERAVRAALGRHVILRTSWVFSPHGSNFVKTMLRLAQELDELAVVHDQHGCPTAATEVAGAILALLPGLRAGAWGTYHFCGAGRATWFDFAGEIFAERARLTGLAPPVLRPIRTAERQSPAQRPANSVLDCTRIKAVFGIAPRPWRESLREVLGALLAERETAR